MSRLALCISTMLLLALPASVSAQAETFVIREDGPSRGVFVSDAMLDTVKGVSKKISGRVQFDPNDLGTASGQVKLPVKSLRTGIDLRDKHLRGSDWMHASKYPNIEFQITGVEGASKLEPGKTHELTIKGRFSAHGKTKSLATRAQVRLQGDKLHVKSRFKIDIQDYGIDVPMVVQMKFTSELQIKVDIVAVRQDG